MRTIIVYILITLTSYMPQPHPNQLLLNQYVSLRDLRKLPSPIAKFILNYRGTLVGIHKNRRQCDPEQLMYGVIRNIVEAVEEDRFRNYTSLGIVIDFI